MIRRGPGCRNGRDGRMTRWMGAAALTVSLTGSMAGCSALAPVAQSAGREVGLLNFGGATYAYYIDEGTGIEVGRAVFVLVDGVPHECPSDEVPSCGATIREAKSSGR